MQEPEPIWTGESPEQYLAKTAAESTAFQTRQPSTYDPGTDLTAIFFPGSKVHETIPALGRECDIPGTTDRPWRVFERDNGDIHLVCLAGIEHKPQVVAVLPVTSRDSLVRIRSQQWANAELILRAVHNYTDLRRACWLSRQYIDKRADHRTSQQKKICMLALDQALGLFQEPEEEFVWDDGSPD